MTAARLGNHRQLAAGKNMAKEVRHFTKKSQ